MAAVLRRAPRIPFPQILSAALSTAASGAAAAQAEAKPPPTHKPLSRLKSAIRSTSDPDRIAELFLSSSHLRYFQADRALYKLAVTKLARARRPDLVERVLDPLLSSNKSEGLLLRLMTLYTSANMPDHAVRAFHSAAAATDGPTLTDRSLSALLSAHLKANQFTTLIESFNHIPKELNITPGVVSHNVLLKALCENGDVAAARQTLDEMSHKELSDIVSYNTVLQGYLSKGDEAGFDELLKEACDKGLDGNAVTYACRAAALCRKSECAKAEELFDEMGAKKISPTRAMFKNIVTGYCKEGDAGSALRVFKRFRFAKRLPDGDALKLDSETYHALVRALVKKRDFGSALSVCKESLAESLIPPFKVVKQLIEGLKGESKLDSAKDLMDMMRVELRGDSLKAWKKFEGEHTYNCKITELCRNKESAKAETLLDVMVSEGIQPNVASFKTIIEGLCKEGDFTSALRVFERMKVAEKTSGNEHFAPDALTYIMLTTGLVEKGELDSAFEVCKECLTKKLVPPFELVKQLVEGLAENSKVDDAKDIVERMRASVKGDVLDGWTKFEGTLALELPEVSNS